MFQFTTKCAINLLFCLLQVCLPYVSGGKRFVVDGPVDFTAALANLTAEVEKLKAEQSTLTTNFTRMHEEVKQLNQVLVATKTELNSSKAAINQLTRSTASSATYTRWGKSSCPTNDVEVVYTGYVGGSNWNDDGGATNYLCLVKDPYLRGNGSINKGAQVFGAEYVMDNGNWASTSQRLFGKDLSFQDAPCAVCRTQRLSTVLMLPGKNTCESGWTLEYEGLLSSGFYGHKAGSEFVCLDQNPDVIPGGRTKQLGKLFYVVEALCGSLRCPPYESGKDLTCAVCSK